MFIFNLVAGYLSFESSRVHRLLELIARINFGHRHFVLQEGVVIMNAYG